MPQTNILAPAKATVGKISHPLQKKTPTIKASVRLTPTETNLQESNLVIEQKPKATKP